MEETPQRWRQPKGPDRTEMRKEEKRLRCNLLNGSVWNTEKKYMRRYKGMFDTFFGIEHGLRRKWRSSLAKRLRMDGGLQLTRQESRMKEQAARIKSIHQEEF